MTIMDRIRRAFRSGGSTDQVEGATVGTQVGLGQIAATEREEFPPEEFASDDQEESE